MPQPDTRKPPQAGPAPQEGAIIAAPYLETASATTDPDNANSGSAAYAIVAIALVALLCLGSALGGALSGIIRMAASEGSSYYEQVDGRGYSDSDGGSLREILEELEGSDGAGGTSRTSETFES